MNFIGLWIIKNIHKLSLNDLFNKTVVSFFWQNVFYIYVSTNFSWYNLNYISNKYNLNKFLRVISVFIKNYNNIIFFINNNIVRDLYFKYIEKKISKYRKLYLKNY